MKKFILVSLIILGLMFAGSNATANTVSIYLEGVAADIDISAFQFAFYDPDAKYGYPLAYDWDNLVGDFNITWGSGQPPDTAWLLESYTIMVVGPLDYATGYAAASHSTANPAIALNDGLVVELSSSTFFGLNSLDASTTIWDFDNNPLDLQISVEWDNGNQTITLSQVPIPGALWLLGSGLIGMIGVRKKLFKT